ncbi:MAG: hypothetical protein ACRCWS_08020 [Propionibacteriaceae bacterium]
MSQWHRAVAFALTGVTLDLADDGSLDWDQLREQLAAAGWGAAAIAALKHERMVEQLPWPVPIPAELRQGCGFAQLAAAVAAAEDQLGLRVAEQPATPTRPLTEAERRLMADLPPHFGRI